MIFTLTLNPAVDRELTVDSIEFDTVLRATEWRVDCGGKGFNVARMLQSLGLPSTALGFAAGRAGELLSDKLQELGIETDFVWVEGETRTNVSIVGGDNGHYVKVNEPGPSIGADDIARMKEKVQARVQAGDWWVLAGSLPPGVPAEMYGELIEIIHSAGAKVFLDTSSEALAKSCGTAPLLVKPNAEEANELTGLPVASTREIAEAAKAICVKGPVHVIVSLGKDGAVLVDKKQAWKALSPKIVEKNPIGAGDSMVAGVIWGLSAGEEIVEALRRGVACGAATASRTGTAVGTLAQVRDLLEKVQVENVEEGEMT